MSGSHTIEYYTEVKNRSAWTSCINDIPFITPDEKKKQVAEENMEI